jgi:hypothetical protein
LVWLLVLAGLAVLLPQALTETLPEGLLANVCVPSVL